MAATSYSSLVVLVAIAKEVSSIIFSHSYIIVAMAIILSLWLNCRLPGPKGNLCFLENIYLQSSFPPML